MDQEQVHYSVSGRVIDSSGARSPIGHAEVRLHETTRNDHIEVTRTDAEGRFHFSTKLDPKLTYYLEGRAFGLPTGRVALQGSDRIDIQLDLNLGLRITPGQYARDGQTVEPAVHGRAGRCLVLTAESSAKSSVEYKWHATGASITPLSKDGATAEVMPQHAGQLRVTLQAMDPEGARASTAVEIAISEPEVQAISGKVAVSLERSASHHTLDQALWMAIRNRTRAISFQPYREFIDKVFGLAERESLGIPALDRKIKDLGAHMHGVGAYHVLKLATEVFLLMECGVRIGIGREEDVRLFYPEEESGRVGERVTLDFVQAKLHEYLGHPPQLPYITRVVEAAFPWLESENGRDRVLLGRINQPCLIELIYCYWLEEGMQVQSMKAIERRFQNVHSPEGRDPLANFELDPLRPLGNILWGKIQNEINELSVRRRAYEYAHEYGLTLYGKATMNLRPADNRSKFLEAFHNLLHLSSVFFKEDNDTTVIADGFPLLNALKEVHLILAQGAHNQFGDLPWTARAEMLLQEWILARPEIRDFLQSRQMVPYKEPWMPQVDSMKTLQGWTDVTVTHFRDLAVYGEQILLSIRYGDWIELTNEDHAKNWARYWRPEIQAYMHAYRAVTGVDLTAAEVDATVPGVHLLKRQALQQQRVR
jgi:hypothetical protein